MNWHRRSLLIFVLGLLFGLAVARIFCWQGVFVPIRIASGSMVPTLHGVHFAVVCDDCEFSFQCDATSSPESGKAVCPNCGFAGNVLTKQQLRLGQRVLIDRFPYLLRMPRRWDLVAFYDPQASNNKAVKRVVGLPGEIVVIRQGELFVDGHILRKPIHVQRSMAVLVHDDAHRPKRTSNMPPRWYAAQDSSGWESNSTGYQFSPVAGVGHVDWLRYRNWRCFASPFPRSEETPVRDHYGYNQNTSRGKLHDVSDLTLSCRVRWSRPSRLWLRVRDGRDAFEVELDRRHATATIWRNGVVIGSWHCPLTDVCNLEFGICDRQVFLTVNRRVAFRVAFEPSEQGLQPTTSPLALGAELGKVMIADLKVYRDVYYLDPNGWGLDWTTPTKSKGREILVLGDNVPISLDSRRWDPPQLSHKSLIGRVLTPF